MGNFILEPAHLPVEFDPGDSYKTALERIGILFPGNCGSQGRCLACRIEIQAVREAGLTEIDTQTFRLAYGCQEPACENAVVRMRPPVIDSELKRLTGRLPIFPGKGYCVVVDLGTTVVALHLLNRETGEIVGQRTFLNPQLFGGGDVISRLDSALNKGQLEAMSAVICKAIGGCIAELRESVNIGVNSLDILVVGNSVMEQLFLGLNDAGLASSPFRSALEGLGCVAFPSGNIDALDADKSQVAPVISGYIGGDTVVAIFAAELHKNGATRLLIDFGSNCEIVLAANGFMYAVSCAAGPAFEGVGLRCGMPAVKGAISGIDFSGEPVVIGGIKPRGICGSGYIAILDYLLLKKAIRIDGRIVEPDSAKGSIRICAGEYSDIFINQEDIRKLQLAKAAVRTGIQEICACAGVLEVQIDEIILTGSFGSQIDSDSAAKLGLIPANKNRPVRYLQSAASLGGLMALSIPDGLEILENIAQNVKVINMAEQDGFEDRFVINLALGDNR